MADALGVDVGEGAEKLVNVEFDFEDGHGGLELVEVSRGSIDSLWHVLLDEVEVYFILLRCDQRCLHAHEIIDFANPVSVGVVECLELDDVWVADDPHNLELSVLHNELVPRTPQTPSSAISIP